MDNLKDIVSKNIIYLRTNKKMTQLELGEALNYSDKAVSKWERGEAIPDAYVLKKLSVLFGVSVDFLLCEHSTKELAQAPKSRLDRKTTIILISFLGTWTLAFIIFATLWVVGYFRWLLFVYALPVSLIVMIVLTAVWRKEKANIFYISCLVWSILIAIYLSYLQNNWWLLFIIGILAQIIVLLSYRIRVKK